MTIYLPELHEDKTYFPNVSCALADPNGLLAMGGDLCPKRIFNAYKKGIFPWFSEGDPILWWSPSERAVINPKQCHISKSMRRLLRKNNFTVTVNHAFNDVITRCAKPRAQQTGTWITDNMIDAYKLLHQQGHAHSIEVWQEQQIVGGLYGVCVGSIFCGESMFSLVNNSSKIAFIALNQHITRFQGTLIDCQMQTEHLSSLGVKVMPRAEFISYLQQFKKQQITQACWQPQSVLIDIDKT